MNSPILSPAHSEDRQIEKRSELGPLLLIGACYLVAAAKFFIFINRYSVNLFFWDHWDFENGPLFEHHSLWQIFRWQHGPPRLGVGALMSALVDPFFHWSSRAQAFEAGILVLLASFCGLWLKRRLWGRIEYVDAAIPFLFLVRNQAEAFIAGANIAHGPMPLLLVILYSVAWTLRSQRWKYSLVVILNFLLIYTGFGIFMGVVTPLLLTIELLRAKGSGHSRTYPLLALIAALASLASFLSGYVFAPAVDCFAARPQNPLPYLWFIALMLANFAGIKGMGLVATVAGAVIALAMLIAFGFAAKGVIARPSTSDPPESREGHYVVAALMAYALLFCLNTAIGRICLGIDAGQASRYIPYLILAFFALYLSILEIRPSITRKLMLSGALVFAVWCGLHLNYMDWLIARNRAHDQRAWRECYLQRESVAECDAITRTKIYPWPEATHLQEKLQFLKQKHLNLYSDQK
ncbi:MAG TPA: hypothetical protein VF493_16465 [Terriglobales bacterium]